MMPGWRFVLRVWLVLAAASCGGSTSQPMRPEAATPPETLEHRLERIRAQHGLPGLAVAVVRGGKVVSSAVAGVRSLSSGAKLQSDDRFHIASCTKSMTATLAALLVQEGRLDWTSRLVDVVPELRERIRPEYRDATLEQLLAHAAQMPAYTQFPRKLQIPTQGAACAKILSNMPNLLFPSRRLPACPPSS